MLDALIMSARARCEDRLLGGQRSAAVAPGLLVDENCGRFAQELANARFGALGHVEHLDDGRRCQRGEMQLTAAGVTHVHAIECEDMEF